MSDERADIRISVVILIPEKLPYEAAWIGRCIDSVARQDIAGIELIIIDGRSHAAADWPAPPSTVNLRHVSGQFSGRAAMCNRALREARSHWLIMLHTDLCPVTLRRSAARAFLMAAERHQEAAMVYGDYERMDPAGTRSEIHVPTYHRGRLRDTLDLGPAVLYSTRLLRQIEGFDERFQFADRYDVRLKLSERGELVSIANRRDGSPATMHSGGPSHNVFDYLMASRAAQVEMEVALTEHLKRIDAYLAPGAHFQPIQVPAHDRPSLLASVIIPVNRRPEFIGSAIQSVQAQTVREVEAVVVVNGGEEDPSATEVRRFMSGGDLHDPSKPEVRLVILDINNIGLSLNSGLEAARGRYYVQLDSDDRLKPNAVEKILGVFRDEPEAGMVIGSYEVWDLDSATGQLTRNTAIPVVTHDEWTADNGRNNLLRINGAGAPRAAPVELLRRFGGFGINDSPHSRNYGEDYDLVLRISEQFAMGRVWEPIYEVVRHAGGTDHRIDENTIARNDDAKDHMRLEAILRRQNLNADFRGARRSTLCG